MKFSHNPTIEQADRMESSQESHRVTSIEQLRASVTTDSAGPNDTIDGIIATGLMAILVACFAALRLLGAQISILAFIASVIAGASVAIVGTVYVVGKSENRQIEREAIFNNLK